MNNNPIKIESIINAPADRIWDALTNKNKMNDWYFDIDKFKPEIGFEFEFTGKGSKGEEYLHHCKITEIEPGNKLSYQWRYEGIEGLSLVTFEIFPEGVTTRVVLTHDGLETFPTGNPDFARESFVQGWTYLVGTALKEFAEKS